MCLPHHLLASCRLHLISPDIVGILQDHINDWSKTALCLTSIFFLAAIIWFIEHVLKKLLDVAHGFQMLIDPKGVLK
ncbi:probable sphingolipid transporter spinster homolog 3 isoform X1 [Arachis hypogaea]|uniref:probable sphingolipid transporter spinster homolog 3 isoform X1 n=1 Tax=Arachis hypogaea TaxID=3818 RepID=UPI000DEC183B|nr:uncharacterized protein LOC112796685 isoform X1 [Arachis hypogaea]XP_025696431.1 uncharacterized protein LOC112797615 isoform X1 [Arachis hypogaea]